MSIKSLGYITSETMEKLEANAKKHSNDSVPVMVSSTETTYCRHKVITEESLNATIAWYDMQLADKDIEISRLRQEIKELKATK